MQYERITTMSREATLPPRRALSTRPCVFGASVLVSLVAIANVLAADEPPQAADQDLKAAVDKACACVFKVECLDRIGSNVPSVLSAVAIDDTGFLLTVGLRAAGDHRLCVRDSTGKRHEARWVASDELSGLTLLHVEPGAVHVPQMSKTLPEIGSAAIVVGNPFGLSHSVSVGNISGLDRSVSFSDGVGRGLIQFTAPVFPGDSGGLLADRKGRMLGIVSTALGDPTSEGGTYRQVTGIGFAIPVAELRLIAQRLRDGEKTERGYLGITVEHAEPAGARVTSVSQGSPAQSAGLKVDDVVIAIDSDEVKGFDDLASRIERLRPGARVKLKVKRDDNEPEFEVTLGDRSKLSTALGRRPTEPIWPDRLWRSRSDNSLRDFRNIDAWLRNSQVVFGPENALLGVQTQPVTESLAKSLGLTATDGALVNSVVPDSPADRAGLRSSDLIVELDGEPVNSPLQLHERIQKAGPGAKVKLEIVRDGKKETVEATLAQQPLTFGSGDLGFWPRGPRNILLPDQAASRMDALEERVSALEKRIEELEKRLQNRAGDSTPTGDKR